MRIYPTKAQERAANLSLLRCNSQQIDHFGLELRDGDWRSHYNTVLGIEGACHLSVLR